MRRFGKMSHDDHLVVFLHQTDSGYFNVLETAPTRRIVTDTVFFPVNRLFNEFFHLQITALVHIAFKDVLLNSRPEPLDNFSRSGSSPVFHDIVAHDDKHGSNHPMAN